MARKYSASCETSPLETGVENLFLTLIHQEPRRLTSAIDCIGNRINRIPSDEVLYSIIFEILMKRDCNNEAAIAASRYLNNTLTIYPPSDYSRRSYYKAALTGRRSLGFTNLWSVFHYIVHSSFVHYKLYRSGEDKESNFIPYPNCDILIDFYIRVLTESYDYLCSERIFYEGGEKSLVMELFWPTESYNISAAKGYPREFLEDINVIYLHSARISKVFAFTNLHNLLNLMVKCIMHAEYVSDKDVISTNVPDSLLCSSLCLLDIIKVLFNICKEAFSSHENLKLFMHRLSSKALQFRLCEYKLYELLNSRQPSDRKFSPCTLHTIVTCYMLPNKLSTGKKRGRKKLEKNELTKEEKQEKKDAPSSSKTNNKDESVLHELCRANKPADLYLVLISPAAPDVNEINSLGQTPLHVACLSQSNLCVKILIDECSDDSKQKLNFGATDKEGLTSLHVAVQKNAIDITRQILRKGGSKLLDVKDKCGQKPSHYASSKEMSQVLKEFQVETVPDKCETQQQLKTVDFSALDVPSLQNYKEYALFCHCLNFLINYYMDIYNLRHVRRLMWNENSTLVEVLEHKDQKCSHFTTSGENTVCSEDFECLKMLPDILSHFVKRTSKRSKDKNLNLDLELLPAQMFASVFE